MIKIYCQDGDEYQFENCLCYDRTDSTCKKYEINEGEIYSCPNCPYANENIQFIQHDSECIMIETDEDDLDVKTCLCHTFYNYLGCGMVDLSKHEDCSDCRFWYENVEVIKVKKGEL
jgi:hypothetical protein